MFKILFLYLLLFDSSAWAKKAELTVEEQFELGQKYLRRGYYSKAIEQFNRIRNHYRDDPMAISSELALADVYFKQGEWDQARIAYDEFRRRHPRHEKTDYASYHIGLSLFKQAPRFAGRDQTWTIEALQAWKPFVSKYPDSEYRTEVEEMVLECQNRLAKKEFIIAKFYLRRNAWIAVQRRSEGLISNFPKSPYTAEAMSMLVLAFAHQDKPEASERVLKELEALDSSLAQKTSKKRDKSLQKKQIEQQLESPAPDHKP